MNDETKYSPWHWHNKALKEHPEYQMEGMIDCLREEIGMAMPISYLKEVSEAPKRVTEPQWNKRQYDRVQQLEARVLHYQKKVEELLSSRKRKPKQNLDDIYSNKGRGGEDKSTSEAVT